MPKHNENIQHATSMTKRQRARWEQERLKQRRVIIAVASVIGLVVALVAIGLVVDKVIVPNKTVATVNGVEISNGEYQRFRTITQAQRAYSTYGQAQQFAQFQQQSGDQFGPQITADIESLKLKSEPVNYEILDQLIDNQVIKDGTAAKQIVVTDEELQRSLAEKFGGVEQPAVVPTTVPVSSTDSLTPTAPVSPTAIPTLTAPEAQSKVDTAIQTYYGTLKEFIELTSPYGTTKLPFTQADFKTFVIEQERMLMLRERLGETLVAEDQAIKEVYADADQIFIPVTFTETADITETAAISATAWQAGKAQIDAIAKELEGGADFEVVQAEKSPDEAASPSTGLRPLTEYAALGITEPISTQEVGVIGEPYRSANGWHIVRVKQRELRPSQSDLDQKRGEAIAKWVTDQRATITIQRFPEPTATPAPPTVEPLPTLPAEAAPTTDPATQATPTP